MIEISRSVKTTLKAKTDQNGLFRHFWKWVLKNSLTAICNTTHYTEVFFVSAIFAVQIQYCRAQIYIYMIDGSLK